MFRFLTPVVKNLLIANIAIALLQGLLRLPLNEIFGLRVVFSEYFRPYQFFTYMWLHDTSGLRHILGNMIILFFAGPRLEMVWGSKRFLTFYLVCGIGAGIFFGVADFFEKREIKQKMEAFVENPDPEKFRIFVFDFGEPRYDMARLNDLSNMYYDNPDNTSYITTAKDVVKGISSFYIDGNMVGASGAIFGLLMALFMLFPNTEVYLYFLFPVKVKYVVGALLFYEIYAEINRVEGDTVAHLAHLGGAIIAYFLIKYWQSQNHRFY